MAAMNTVALAVMRLQPLHNGHKLIIDTMLGEARIAIVGIGSVQARGDRNPYGFEERAAMVRVLYPNENRVKIVGLKDIGAPTKAIWAAYVLDEIRKAGLPAPECYYAGSVEDGSWFEGVLPVRIVDRTTLGQSISATQIRADLQSGRNVEDRVPQAVIGLIKET